MKGLEDLINHLYIWCINQEDDDTVTNIHKTTSSKWLMDNAKIITKGKTLGKSMILYRGYSLDDNGFSYLLANKKMPEPEYPVISWTKNIECTKEFSLSLKKPSKKYGVICVKIIEPELMVIDIPYICEQFKKLKYLDKIKNTVNKETFKKIDYQLFIIETYAEQENEVLCLADSISKKNFNPGEYMILPYLQ